MRKTLVGEILLQLKLLCKQLSTDGCQAVGNKDEQTAGGSKCPALKYVVTVATAALVTATAFLSLLSVRKSWLSVNYNLLLSKPQITNMTENFKIRFLLCTRQQHALMCF